MRPEEPALERFLKRLLQRSELTADEQRAILKLKGQTQRIAARSDIVSPGQRMRSSCLVVRGLVARFDQMRDGQRQITAFHIAGDMCDLHSLVVPSANWAITAVSDVTVAHIPHGELQQLATRYPAIAMAFWRDGTVDSLVLAKWIGNLGRKDALARVAHVVCEMGLRMEMAGLGSRTAFDLLATQEQLADATGITPVHLNRMLQELRGRDLLTFRSGRVEILDWPSLVAAADFDPAYLLLDGRRERGVALETDERWSMAGAAS